MRKGWYKIDGVQDGDRTLEQQMLGLSPALEFCQGCNILDLGCAEGLISREFVKAGASHVTAVEVVEGNATQAKIELAELPATILCENVEHFVNRHWEMAVAGELKYDLVLALAILHKLKVPERALDFIGMVANRAVIRTAERTPGYIQDTRSRERRIKIVKPLRKLGLELEFATDGPFNEWTGYFRREDGPR